MTALLVTGGGDGDSKLWIVVLAIIVVSPIVVGLALRWWDRHRD